MPARREVAFCTCRRTLLCFLMFLGTKSVHEFLLHITQRPPSSAHRPNFSVLRNWHAHTAPSRARSEIFFAYTLSCLLLHFRFWYDFETHSRESYFCTIHKQVIIVLRVKDSSILFVPTYATTIYSKFFSMLWTSQDSLNKTFMKLRNIIHMSYVDVLCICCTYSQNIWIIINHKIYIALSKYCLACHSRKTIFKSTSLVYIHSFFVCVCVFKLSDKSCSKIRNDVGTVNVNRTSLERSNGSRKFSAGLSD